MNSAQMTDERLKNPVWAALQTDHCSFAVGGLRVQRYQRDVGPFVGVAEPGPVADPDLLALVDVSEEVYIVGVIPDLPQCFRVLAPSSVLQMVCAESVAIDPGLPEVSLLSADSAGDMQELTALAYPYFFRSRTQELGRYFGHWVDRRLVAMAGERMSFGPYREVSGVCTHPDYVRRGYAKQLISHVVNMILADGKQAFLHVAAENDKAQALYRQLGFVDANVVPMVHVRRECS
jgi:ribosomal protein S18 acetylase RimI-like enzyme